MSCLHALQICQYSHMYKSSYKKNGAKRFTILFLSTKQYFPFFNILFTNLVTVIVINPIIFANPYSIISLYVLTQCIIVATFVSPLSPSVTFSSLFQSTLKTHIFQKPFLSKTHPSRTHRTNFMDYLACLKLMVWTFSLFLVLCLAIRDRLSWIFSPFERAI